MHLALRPVGPQRALRRGDGRLGEPFDVARLLGEDDGLARGVRLSPPVTRRPAGACEGEQYLVPVVLAGSGVQPLAGERSS